MFPVSKVLIRRLLFFQSLRKSDSNFWFPATGPQGGVKGSEWGRQNAGWGLNEFLQEKFVSFHGN